MEMLVERMPHALVESAKVSDERRTHCKLVLWFLLKMPQGTVYLERGRSQGKSTGKHGLFEVLR